MYKAASMQWPTADSLMASTATGGSSSVPAAMTPQSLASFDDQGITMDMVTAKQVFVEIRRLIQSSEVDVAVKVLDNLIDLPSMQRHLVEEGVWISICKPILSERQSIDQRDSSKEDVGQSSADVSFQKSKKAGLLAFFEKRQLLWGRGYLKDRPGPPGYPSKMRLSRLLSRRKASTEGERDKYPWPVGILPGPGAAPQQLNLEMPDVSDVDGTYSQDGTQSLRKMVHFRSLRAASTQMMDSLPGDASSPLRRRSTWHGCC
eukprot:TRINITY_DN15386_c0_g1_i3.p1 TRINITY_DN15386_c0_g1~~TRINITY_DN15386_c0_g1_i3.p1  ORF type:complete len:261 (+),score=43.02 TRINITY_DN15386_c0_g1_i3:71-853(+)